MTAQDGPQAGAAIGTAAADATTGVAVVAGSGASAGTGASSGASAAAAGGALPTTTSTLRTDASTGATIGAAAPAAGGSSVSDGTTSPVAGATTPAWLPAGTFSGDGTAYSEAVAGTGAGFACSYRYLNPYFSTNFLAINKPMVSCSPGSGWGCQQGPAECTGGVHLGCEHMCPKWQSAEPCTLLHPVSPSSWDPSAASVAKVGAGCRAASLAAECISTRSGAPSSPSPPLTPNHPPCTHPLASSGTTAWPAASASPLGVWTTAAPPRARG